MRIFLVYITTAFILALVPNHLSAEKDSSKEEETPIMKAEGKLAEYYPTQVKAYTSIKTAIFEEGLDKTIIRDEIRKDLIEKGCLLRDRIDEDFHYSPSIFAHTNSKDGTVAQNVIAKCQIYVHQEDTDSTLPTFYQINAWYKDGVFRTGKISAFELIKEEKKGALLFEVSWDQHKDAHRFSNARLRIDREDFLFINEKGEVEK